MPLISCSRFVLRPFQRVAFSKRTSGGVNYNMGALTNRDRGDAFTEPEVYRNQKNITAKTKVEKKQKLLLHEEQKRGLMNRLGLGSVEGDDLHSGRRLPRTPAEISASRSMDDEAVVGKLGPSSSYDVDLRNLMQREADRRSHMMDKFGQAPTSREFHKLFSQLREADDAEDKIESYQKRLVEDHGVYPTTRMDAFMLDDDRYFPEWVNALPYAIRDRVKFGSMGLTEEDEALRVQLGRLPRDRRVEEWKRMKAAKAYKAANEETLTLAELRDTRQGKRRFHWLLRKRQKRAAALRRMALRRPDGLQDWPSTVVDYSQRIAFIAQHVENGVQTKGQWPLDPAELTKAKIKRKQAEAERTFLMSPEEKKLTAQASRMNGGIKELLSSFDLREKPFKRLSRKVYANRVNAIVHGDQDEHGRKYRKMHGIATRRLRPYDSLSEIALEKEVRKEPRVNVSGLNRTADEDWTRHFKSWVDGMPSSRYGA